MKTSILVATAFTSCFIITFQLHSNSAIHKFSTEESDIQQQSIDSKIALNAMGLSIRSVTSGTCHIECLYTHEPNQRCVGKSSKLGEHVFIAFDRAHDLYRYDNLETRYKGRPDQVIVRPEMVLSSPSDWTKSGKSSGSRLIFRRTREDVDEPFQRHREPFMTTLADCRNNKMHTTHSGLLDHLLNNTLLESNVLDFDRVSAVHTRIVLQNKSSKTNATVRYELVLDSSKGYLPVRVLISHNGTQSGEWTTPDITETEWISVNSVYVPNRTKCVGSTNRKSEFTFSMIWEHVNETLDSALFTEEAFSLKTGDLMAVATNDQVVIEKVVGFEPPKMPRGQADPSDLRPRMAVLLIVHAAVIGGWLYFWRRRKRTSTSR